MWIKFLYFIWVLIPCAMLISAVWYKIREKKKPGRMNRSFFFIQQTTFTIAVGIISFLVDIFLIPIISAFFALTNTEIGFAQFAIYPLVFVFLAPYAGKISPPETLQDRIQRKGHLEVLREQKKKDANSGS